MKLLEELVLHHGAESGIPIASIAIVISLVLAAVTFWMDLRSRRVENLILLTREYRELWSMPIRQPELARVLDPKPNLKDQPVTFEEDRFVLLVISHLNAVLEAGRHREVNLSNSMSQDVGYFFRLPIPASIWKAKRQFQDARLVHFIDASQKELSAT